MIRVKASSVSMANMLTMSLKDPPQSHKVPENVTMNQFFLIIHTHTECYSIPSNPPHLRPTLDPICLRRLITSWS